MYLRCQLAYRPVAFRKIFRHNHSNWLSGRSWQTLCIYVEYSLHDDWLPGTRWCVTRDTRKSRQLLKLQHGAALVKMWRALERVG
jgi:hypothetical protein